MSRLSQQSKKVNWAKLQIKGGAGNLIKASAMLDLKPDDRMNLLKAIMKIETMMVNKLEEDYEAFKATELYER